MSVRFMVVAALSVALAGCEGSDEVEAPEQSADAQGEIQGGTTSDEMVPLEEIRSASPPDSEPSGTEDADDEG